MVDAAAPPTPLGRPLPRGALEAVREAADANSERLPALLAATTRVREAAREGERASRRGVSRALPPKGLAFNGEDGFPW